MKKNSTTDNFKSLTRKNWSAKADLKRIQMSKSARLLMSREPPSLKLRTLLISDSTNSIVRPFTAISLLGTSNTLQNPTGLTEIEGLSKQDIEKIYKSKCKDLQISTLKDQEIRFYNYCVKSCINRTIGLNENGFGSESVKTLASILKKNIFFCRLSLSKNNIGEQGACYLGEALKKNKNIIAVDISSNDISPEGSSKFFEGIQRNESIVSINISSLEGLHRNRLGVKGAESVSEVLKHNRILTHLNIGDTGIGKEGLEFITQGIAHNKVLVFLDISNNGFSHYSLEDFSKVLPTTNLKELSLSGNKIGNKGCELISKNLSLRSDKMCGLVKLDLSNCEITAGGLSKICDAIENNPNLTSLSLDNNPLGQYAGGYFCKCLMQNTCLQSMSLNNCCLKEESVLKICEGLSKNNYLKKISLSKNYINDGGAVHIAEMITHNCSLISIDLSYNLIKNKGGIILANSLRKNSTIENLILTENSLKDESGRILAEISRFKNNLLKIELVMNPINLKYIKEIKENLARNNFNYKQLLSPRLKKEIEKLTMNGTEIDEVFSLIETKAKEKIEYEEKIEQNKHKLHKIIEEESEKYHEIMQELNEYKEISTNLSKEIEAIFIETNRLKFVSEKQVKDLTEAISVTTNELKKLDKRRIHLKEEFGLRRGQLNYVLGGLKVAYKDAQINYNSAISSSELVKLKSQDLTQELNALKFPHKSPEENKERKSRRKSKKLKSKKSIIPKIAANPKTV